MAHTSGLSHSTISLAAMSGTTNRCGGKYQHSSCQVMGSPYTEVNAPCDMAYAATDEGHKYIYSTNPFTTRR
jgi:hypothetical protein